MIQDSPSEPAAPEGGVASGSGHNERPPVAGFLRRPGVSSVREGGVEPPRPFGHWNLNPARLPIPPPAHGCCRWILSRDPGCSVRVLCERLPTSRRLARCRGWFETPFRRSPPRGDDRGGRPAFDRHSPGTLSRVHTRGVRHRGQRPVPGLFPALGRKGSGHPPGRRPRRLRDTVFGAHLRSQCTSSEQGEGSTGQPCEGRHSSSRRERGTSRFPDAWIRSVSRIRTTPTKTEEGGAPWEY